MLKKITFFVITILFTIFANEKTIVLDIQSINIGPESKVLTEKLKGLLSQTEKYNIVEVSQFNQLFEDSSINIENCTNKNCIKKLAALTGADIIIWGSIGQLDNTFSTTIYEAVFDSTDMLLQTHTEEIDGSISDVLKYSIYNIAMKIAGMKEKVIKKQPEEKTETTQVINATPVIKNEIPTPPKQKKTTGWLKIKVNSEDVKLFINGEPAGRGSKEVELPVGVHRIVAKTDEDTKTDLIEIYKNDISSISFDIGDSDERKVRFLMSYDASWMLGDNIEFGPSHMAGIEIKKKHLIAAQYYWGPRLFSSEIYGGAFNYMYSINVHDIFIARFGGGAGFWMEWTRREYWNDNYNYWDYDYYDDFYFGGPKIRLEVGYKVFHFVIIDATLLLGTDEPKALLNSGFSFRL